MVEESIALCEDGLQADSRGHTAAAERHLRRVLRRAHEAARAQRQGRPLSHDLQRKVAADA
eukprot:4936149-Alexandrium_andersonii.AAC.1